MNITAINHIFDDIARINVCYFEFWQIDGNWYKQIVNLISTQDNRVSEIFYVIIIS